ncbi:sequestosome 1-related [Anaeramoeba ignava]|uniref:Sequestosome 1-related n=1 Tax=Anaeramoeba ignava TaxID=1746090 RepID=A0A9Q0RD22_ANAIG|nr:sequestosome 1-related [Anaeramoeba ignava]
MNKFRFKCTFSNDVRRFSIYETQVSKPYSTLLATICEIYQLDPSVINTIKYHDGDDWINIRNTKDLESAREFFIEQQNLENSKDGHTIHIFVEINKQIEPDDLLNEKISKSEFKTQMMEIKDKQLLTLDNFEVFETLLTDFKGDLFKVFEQI